MKKIVTFVLVVIAVLLVGEWTGITKNLQSITFLQAYFQDLGLMSYVMFILLSIALTVFMLPGQLLAIVAGIVYGGFLGTVLTVAGATLGSSTAFMVGKYIARDYIVEKYGTSSLFKKIEHGVEKNGINFLILTRLVPVFPFALQSYAYAITPMKCSTFTVISFITMIPGSALYVYMAEEISRNGLSMRLFVLFVFTGVFMFIVSFIPKKIAVRKNIQL